MTRGRRLGALVGAALALLWLCRERRAHEAREPAAAVARQLAPRLPPRVVQPEPTGRPPAPAASRAIEVRSVALIASIELEPRRPCRGEEVIVGIALRPEAADAKLFVDGQPGNPALLSFARAGAQSVRVTARDWHDQIEQRELTIDVRDCDAPAELRLSAQQLGNGRVLLRALHKDAAAAGFARYAWDFADGEQLETSGPLVVHDYALRPQERSTSTFLVAVAAHPQGSGRAATAHVPVTLVNPDFIAAHSGAPTLPVTYERFPAIEDGIASASLRVRNILARDVLLEGAELAVFPCDGGPLRELTQADPSWLSRRNLRAAAVEELALSLPLAALGPGACRVQVWLRGSAAGAPVRVPLALELARPDDALRVVDRALISKLQRAAVQLGRRVVTEQDLLSGE